MPTSSELWYQAAVAADEDPARARAAADRAAGGYTAGRSRRTRVIAVP